MIVGTVPYYSVCTVKKSSGRTRMQIFSNSSFIVTLLCFYIFFPYAYRCFSCKIQLMHIYHRNTEWVGRELEAPSIPILLPWAVTPPMKSGWPKPQTTEP